MCQQLPRSEKQVLRSLPQLPGILRAPAFLMQTASAKQVGWQLSLCLQTALKSPGDSCSEPSRVFHSCVLQGVTNHPTCSASSIWEAQRERHCRDICAAGIQGPGSQLSTERFSTETAPAFIPWTCFVPSQFTPLRMNLSTEG